MNVFKKIFKINEEKKVMGYIAKAAAGLVLAFGIYSMVSVNYLLNTVQMFGAGRKMSFEQNMGTKSDFQFQQPRQNNNGTELSENFKGGRAGKPGLAGGERGMMEGKGRSVSIPSLLASNLAIMGIFEVVTYYIEKLLLRKRTK